MVKMEISSIDKIPSTYDIIDRRRSKQVKESFGLSKK
jgi:hypothetical protein